MGYILCDDWDLFVLLAPDNNSRLRQRRLCSCVEDLRWEGRGRAREVTMGIGIFTESSNIPQEVCQFRSAPAERMEAEKLNKTLTEVKGCGNGR